MGDSRVGFGFQADVVSVGSLSHTVTGRMLKAMSDGGVDMYAVTASTWLGTQIHVRTSLESTVHSQISAKKGFQGFLAKTLSFGWGHSVIAVEMARTKAGTNALLLIGSLATGSSYYIAAQCLSELLSICGCETDKIPNVDTLKPMIAYLAPITHDLGFSKVLEHITTTVSHNVLKTKPHCPQGLTAVGEAPILAGAIKQLIFSAEKGERIYLIVKQRGAWLAAFASHIIGMSVEVMLDDTVVWGSGGSRGHAALQLQYNAINPNYAQTVSPPGLKLVDAPSTPLGVEDVIIDYALKDALVSELGHHPTLTDATISVIHHGISRLSYILLRELKMRTSSSSRHALTTHRINGSFPSTLALAGILSDFGIRPDSFNTAAITAPSIGSGWTGTLMQMNGLSCLSHTEAETLKAICPIHSVRKNAKSSQCLCGRIGALIHGFASTSAALAQCRYNSSEIRIRSDLLTGKCTTAWSRGCIMDGGKADIALSSHQLLSHLSQLLHGIVSNAISDKEVLELRPNISVLGISSGAYTIFYTCLLEEQHTYDEYGRMITIATGRASVQGELRNLIVEARQMLDSTRRRIRWRSADLSSVAPGTLIEPHYRPSDCSISMEAYLSEKEIHIVTTLVHDVHAIHFLVSLADLFHYLLAVVQIIPRCDHEPDRPFHVTKPDVPGDMMVGGLLSYSRRSGPGATRDRLTVYALAGKKLAQLVQCHECEEPGFQLFACIQCTLYFMPATFGEYRELIIGG